MQRGLIYCSSRTTTSSTSTWRSSKTRTESIDKDQQSQLYNFYNINFVKEEFKDLVDEYYDRKKKDKRDPDLEKLSCKMIAMRLSQAHAKNFEEVDLHGLDCLQSLNVVERTYRSNEQQIAPKKSYPQQIKWICGQGLNSPDGQSHLGPLLDDLFKDIGSIITPADNAGVRLVNIEENSLNVLYSKIKDTRMNWNSY